MLFIDKMGHVDAERVKVKIFPNIERGPMDRVNGIIVHQTDGSTAESTFSSYLAKGALGAHFLIEKDGTIYQTASLKKITRHVGKLQSRCIVTHKCSPAELKLTTAMQLQYTKLSIHEHKKPWPERYPSSDDSIGIEIVGRSKPIDPASDSKTARVYENVTAQQNLSLRWLIAELVATFKVSTGEIYRHPQVSYKNVTEASTARW